MGLRVVIAEDSMLLREGIQLVLDRQPDLEVVAACADLPELLAAVDAHGPDVVVTDVRMPPTSTDEGIRAANGLRHSHPRLGVVVLSQYAEPGYASALLEDGSAGRAYLLKERVSDPGQLAAAVRTVAAGGSVIDPMVVDLLVSASRRGAGSPVESLTARELEVLDQVAQGKSNAAVASALFLSERAVEKHINALFAKLGLGSEPDINRRVKAVLLHLSARGSSSGPA
jgi:DNA-binding NarL/FixJ family response regulator